VPKTETFISFENKSSLGVVKTSQETPVVTSEGLEVKPLTKTPTQRLAYEDYIRLADIIINDILIQRREIDISEIAKMFGLSKRQLTKLVRIAHENWRVYVRDNNMLVLEV